MSKLNILEHKIAQQTDKQLEIYVVVIVFDPPQCGKLKGEVYADPIQVASYVALVEEVGGSHPFTANGADAIPKWLLEAADGGLPEISLDDNSPRKGINLIHSGHEANYDPGTYKLTVYLTQSAK